VFGLTLPKPIAWLIAASLFFSAGGALFERSGVPVYTYTLFRPLLVMEGEVWRLLSWVLLEIRPLALLFACMLIYFVGPDLLYRFGVRRFFLLYFGGGVVVGALTCLIGLLWKDVLVNAYPMGLWPMGEAMLITWAALHPDRQLLVMFMLPVSGRNLIAFTIAITVVFALVYGIDAFIPHFVAELCALLYSDVLSFRRLYLRGRMAMLQRDYKRRAAHLRMVERDDNDKPPRWMH
jgi:membrane associated rhomboid family serine protease